MIPIRLLGRHALLIALFAAPVSAQQLAQNASFEEFARSVNGLTPRMWSVGGQGYELAIDTANALDGRASLRSRRVDPSTYTGDARQFGVANQAIDVRQAHGRMMRFTGWIRTENITDGYAGMWLRVDGGTTGMLHLDNMADRGPRGTTPWTRYVIEVPVDSGANDVFIGVLHPGTGTAWFDSLKVEVYGPAMPRRVATVPRPTAPRASYVPSERPAEDFTRLLSDAELALAPDSITPAVDSAYATWVRNNAKPIRSLGASIYADLSFLKPILSGKRIVQLGESGHGVREFNMAKVRLIKYLHQELGYDVIAFESSLYACDRAGRRPPSTALMFMRNCIFGVWHTAEVVALFEYIAQTQKTNRPLILTGFDTQTSTSADQTRPAFLRDVVAKIDTAYATRVHDTDLAFARSGPSAQDNFAVENEKRLVAFYDSLATWLRTHERQLVRAFPGDAKAPLIARQAAFSMSQFVQQRAAGPGGRGTEIRDRGMADNLDFVLDELHPGRKVMVWAHNFHIQHRGFETGKATQPTAIRTMGTYVAERRRKELYTIGLYMYGGSSAMNDRTVVQVRPATPGSLEAILHHAPWKYSFVDLSRAVRTPGTEWMFSVIGGKEWGINAQSIRPRDEYDAILFIDRTWPPQYVR